MIRTAFRLPFRTIHPADGFFSGSEEVQLALTFAADPTPAQITLADGLMRLFADYSGTGALSGERLAPQGPGVDGGGIAMHSPSVRVYSLGRCRIDDAALVVLCDILLFERVALPLRSLVVSNASPGFDLLQEEGLWSTYPERRTSPAFEIDDQEPESGAYTFVLEFAEPLKATAMATLTAWLRLWVRCVLAGGYALAPIEPRGNYVEPDDAIIEFAATVEWSVFKLRAHPAAIDAMVNLLDHFCRSVQPILRLSIQ